MQCPVCKSVNLVMSERQGIEIDYCPQCRGVWLDRGELDKIVERTSQAPYTTIDRQYRHDSHDEHHHRDQKDYDSKLHDYDYKKKKKRGLLGDLFDFD